MVERLMSRINRGRKIPVLDCPAGGCSEVKVNKAVTAVVLTLMVVGVGSLLYMAKTVSSINVQNVKQTDSLEVTNNTILVGQRKFAQFISIQLDIQKNANKVRERLDMPLNEVVVFNVDDYFPLGN